MIDEYSIPDEIYDEIMANCESEEERQQAIEAYLDRLNDHIHDLIVERRLGDFV